MHRGLTAPKEGREVRSELGRGGRRGDRGRGFTEGRRGSYWTILSQGETPPDYMYVFIYL